MEDIVKAHMAWRVALLKTYDPTDNYKAGRWDSPERKELEKAEKAFDEAVESSEYRSIFEDYASNHDSHRM